MEKNEETKSGLPKLILMIVLSCVSQVVSLAKSSILARTFGVSEEMDAFNFANNISAFIFSFFSAGVLTVVIPCYVKRKNRKNTDAFLTVILCGIVALSAIVLIFKTPLLTLVTMRDEKFITLGGQILSLLIICNMFSFFTNVGTAYFQYLGKYNIPKLTTLFAQLCVVAFLAFNKNISVYGYACAFGAGIVVTALLDVIFALKNGWRYRPVFSVKDKETKKLLATFVPVLFSTGVYQLSLIVDSSIAARMDTGDVTVLNYANLISSTINSLLVNNLLIYFYPKLVKDVEEKKGQKGFWEKTYFFHAVMCLVAVGYAMIGREGISLLFGHGKFDDGAVSRVYLLSVIYVSSLQINVIRDLIYRYFYSYQDTKTATQNSILATAVNVVASLILVRFIGLYGVVVGTAISSVVSLVAVIIKFKKKYGFEEKFIKNILRYLQTMAISAVTFVAVFSLKKLFAVNSDILSLLIWGVLTVIVYVVLTLIFNKKMKDIMLGL